MPDLHDKVFQNGFGVTGLDQLARGLNALISAADLLEVPVAAATLTWSRVGSGTALPARAAGEPASAAAAMSAAAIRRRPAPRPLLERVPPTVCRTLDLPSDVLVDSNPLCRT